MTSAALRALLSSAGFGTSDESGVQEAIALLFARERIAFEREVVLGAGERIDFMVEKVIGLEVKVQGSRMEVLRQLARYAASDRVEALVLATTRLQLTRMPPTVGGKPIVTVPLFGAIL